MDKYDEIARNEQDSQMDEINRKLIVLWNKTTRSKPIMNLNGEVIDEPATDDNPVNDNADDPITFDAEPLEESLEEPLEEDNAAYVAQDEESDLQLGHEAENEPMKEPFAEDAPLENDEENTKRRQPKKAARKKTNTKKPAAVAKKRSDAATKKSAQKKSTPKKAPIKTEKKKAPKNKESKNTRGNFNKAVTPAPIFIPANQEYVLDIERKRAEFLLKNIVKKNPVDTINALYDFYFRYKDGGVTLQEADEFNEITAKTLLLLADCISLERLDERIEIGQKKRVRIKMLASLYRKINYENVRFLLPQINLFINEIESDINDKKRAESYKKLLQESESGVDFWDSLEEFCSIQLSDLIEPPVLKASSLPANPLTLYGFLDGISAEIIALRSELASLAGNKLIEEIKALRTETELLRGENARIIHELNALKNAENEGGIPTDILEEISALKEDINAAASALKEDSGEESVQIEQKPKRKYTKRTKSE